MTFADSIATFGTCGCCPDDGGGGGTIIIPPDWGDGWGHGPGPGTNKLEIIIDYDTGKYQLINCRSLSGTINGPFRATDTFVACRVNFHAAAGVGMSAAIGQVNAGSLTNFWHYISPGAFADQFGRIIVQPGAVNENDIAGVFMPPQTPFTIYTTGSGGKLGLRLTTPP